DETRSSRDQNLHRRSRPFPLRGSAWCRTCLRTGRVSSKGSSTARHVAHHRRVAHGHMRGCAYSDMHAFSSEQIELIAARSRALGDGTRIRILIALEGGEQAVGQIAEAVGTQQSTASKHLQ